LLRLTKLREEKGLNKTRLGQLASVHPAYVGQIESGRVVPYPRTLKRLAKVLGWKGDPEQLLEEVAE
jgi:transcriptional regulator with XRE-family HTH domain